MSALRDTWTDQALLETPQSYGRWCFHNSTKKRMFSFVGGLGSKLLLYDVANLSTIYRRRPKKTGKVAVEVRSIIWATMQSASALRPCYVRTSTKLFCQSQISTFKSPRYLLTWRKGRGIGRPQEETVRRYGVYAKVGICLPYVNAPIRLSTLWKVFSFF